MESQYVAKEVADVDDCIKKQATVVNEDEMEAHNIRMMKYTVSPVVRVAVHP